MARLSQSRKKAFTIVELAIVISIIAVLAAVCIPVFTLVISKAERSDYLSLVKNFNDILSIDEAVNGKPDNVTEAVSVIIAGGYSAEDIAFCSNGYSLAYNTDTNRIVLYKDYYSESDYGEAEGTLCILGMEYADNNVMQKFGNVCIYSYDSQVLLQSNSNAVFWVYTCAESCAVTINSPGSTVYHYGTAESCNITAEQYFLNGCVGNLFLESENIYINYGTGAKLDNIVYGSCACFYFSCGGEDYTIDTTQETAYNLTQNTGITVCRSLDNTPIHEHEFGNWEVITQATCTESGIQRRYCSCGYYEEQEIQAAGHCYTETVFSPTCTDDGYSEYTCSECGDSYTDNYSNATGHCYTETVYSPTCTTGGYSEYTCME